MDGSVRRSLSVCCYRSHAAHGCRQWRSEPEVVVATVTMASDRRMQLLKSYVGCVNITGTNVVQPSLLVVIGVAAYAVFDTWQDQREQRSPDDQHPQPPTHFCCSRLRVTSSRCRRHAQIIGLPAGTNGGPKPNDGSRSPQTTQRRCLHSASHGRARAMALRSRASSSSRRRTASATFWWCGRRYVGGWRKGGAQVMAQREVARSQPGTVRLERDGAVARGLGQFAEVGFDHLGQGADLREGHIFGTHHSSLVHSSDQLPVAVQRPRKCM